ncbi:hypothetical protein E2C01_029722 [Portunus trituberculatus]|uniref:Uncharacterized protein n=1 Tax=Portunus trituberculatus TaxID=210409 RepID=A0A5B7ENN6_PORTR|nr:hypothetical protein [Portunus trituberculatus]
MKALRHMLAFSIQEEGVSGQCCEDDRALMGGTDLGAGVGVGVGGGKQSQWAVEPHLMVEVEVVETGRRKRQNVTRRNTGSGQDTILVPALAVEEKNDCC